MEQKTTPKLDAPKPPEPTPEQPPPEPSPRLNLTEWLPYLDGEPSILAGVLIEKSPTDKNAEFAIKVLNTYTAEQILRALQQFKQQGGATADAIIALEDRKEWLEGLIQAVKMTKSP